MSNEELEIRINSVIEEYDTLRENFREFSTIGEDSREALLEYQRRFIELKADLRPIHKFVASMYEKRNDKASTAIKYRIAKSIMDGVFEDEDKVKYEKCAMSQAEKLAAGSKVYKTFLKQRALYRESFVNINDIREDVTNYITLVRDRLNK